MQRAFTTGSSSSAPINDHVPELMYSQSLPSAGAAATARPYRGLLWRKPESRPVRRHARPAREEDPMRVPGSTISGRIVVGKSQVVE
jgi:hypothetical protein